MNKYIIMGDCLGVPYYLHVKSRGDKFAPEFTWHGLMDNATHFYTKEVAVKTMIEMKPYSKLPMEALLSKILYK